MCCCHICWYFLASGIRQFLHFFSKKLMYLDFEGGCGGVNIDFFKVDYLGHHATGTVWARFEGQIFYLASKLTTRRFFTFFINIHFFQATGTYLKKLSKHNF
jgi:hypothetical protein